MVKEQVQRVKRFLWSAVLLGLALMLSWAGAAQATTSTGSTTDSTTTTSEPPASEVKDCTPEEGLASHSKISTDADSAHPSASASFTVKDGCRVLVFLASFDLAGSADNPKLVDVAPALGENPVFESGDHSLKVKLPTCTHFGVLLAAEKPSTGDQAPQVQKLLKADHAAAAAMSDGKEPAPEPTLLEAIEGDTTDCPTSSSAPSSTEAPTTTAAPGQLPFSGSNSLPILIAALVLLAGGGAALYATRIRSRHAR
jgi:hypothetical protein